MNKKITRLARAGNIGNWGANGLLLSLATAEFSLASKVAIAI